MARHIIHLELSPSGRKRFYELTSELGLTNIAMTSRLVEWLEGQPSEIQFEILRQEPSPDVAKRIIQRMAARQGDDPRSASE